MSYGQIPASTSPLQRETVATALANIDQQINRLDSIAVLYDKAAEMLDGPVPTEAMNEKPGTPPRSLIDNLQRKERRLVQLCNRLESTEVRIQNALG